MSTTVDEKGLAINQSDEKIDAGLEGERLGVVNDTHAFTSLPALDTQKRNLEEKRLVRKLDRRIIPMLCIIYLFACAYVPLYAASIGTNNLL